MRPDTRKETRDQKSAFCVRPVRPGDEEGLRRMFSRLSRASIYERFHAPYPRVPEWALTLFTDPPCGGSLVAVAGDEIVGHALYVRTGYAAEAEMAVLVEDGWQGRGVGRMLVSDLARVAAGRGTEVFSGEVLGENRRALGFITTVFPGTRHTTRGGAYHVRMPLPASGPSDGDAAGRAA